MQLHSQLIDTPVRDAASLILLRDTASAGNGTGSAASEQGLEVFLLQRHGLSDVLGGAYVFPGGKVDAADAALLPRLDQPAVTLHAALAEPDTAIDLAASCYVAALREAFEECGVLLAHGVTPEKMAQALALLRGGHGFADLLAQLGLQLDTRSLHPWSRWITPRLASVSSKRFDTRFFVAAAPAGQHAQHDAHETTHSLWLTPRMALQQYWDRQIALAPPQIMTLAHLARHPNVASVLATAQQQPPAQVAPEPFDDASGTRVLCYPGDAAHSASVRAMPGPTRLYHRDGRFEPDGGFDALFT